MTCTSSRGTKNSGHERSGVFRMHSPPHSKNWTPSPNSKRRPSWANSWKRGFHNRSSLRGGLPNKQFHFALNDPCGRASSAWAKKIGVTVMSALFPPGQIVATPGALAALERAKQPPTCFLARHAIGDWGELEPTDVAENKYSLIHGFRLLSSYQTNAGEKLWIITEADRSATTLLLPEEY